MTNFQRIEQKQKLKNVGGGTQDHFSGGLISALRADVKNGFRSISMV